MLVLLVLFSAGTYLFIPSNLVVSSATVVHTAENGVVKHALDEKNWAHWWNYLHSDTNSAVQPSVHLFSSGNDSFYITQKFYKSADIGIRHHNHTIPTKFLIIPFSTDSTGISWNYSERASSNPFTRFMQYREAAAVKKNMDSVLMNLSSFLNKVQNVYGIPITRTSIQDTLFVSAKTILSAQPHTPEVYALIKKIQAFVAAKGIRQTGNPIYNITPAENNQYQLMAAIPVDKGVPENPVFSNKHMVKGSFMVTDVVGGEQAVDNAWKSLLEYFADYRKTSMAINFTMLITDRQYQPDSSKWITRLYQPVY
ncbi:MAG: GyrI-like domain-containing protein [Chitinophagaceae bacterium]|nr:GyrI-like domain-containing protein [Chitinophagaceae bacterium]